MARFADLPTNLTVFTPPATEPVSTEEANAHCRIETDDEDELIADWITVAREMLEEDTRRSFVTQTRELRLDRFPTARCNSEFNRDAELWGGGAWPGAQQLIELRSPPVQTVTHVKYFDGSGVEQTLDPSAYQVDVKSEPARILPAYGTSWPTARLQPNAVTVRFVAGYGLAAAVPKRVKQAIYLLVGHWYYHREAVGTVGEEIAIGYERLVMSLRWSGSPV